jgi:chaperone-like protein
MAHPLHDGGPGGALATRLAHYAAIGVAGDLLVRGARRLAPALNPIVHGLAVGCMAQGLRLGRAVERAAEEARLTTGDLLAEARGRLGEEARPPAEAGAAAAAGGHDGHEH